MALKPSTLPALTGLRIVGALWVASFHFRTDLFHAWPGLQFLNPIFAVGYFGVPLFFTLSGFLIWHNYGSSELLAIRPTSKFLWRRFARLWPVNVLSQLLAIPLVLWAVVVKDYWGAPIPNWFSVDGWLSSAFMIQEFFSPEQFYPWNQPSWSLSGEMAAYLIFPIVTLIFLSLRIQKMKFAGILTLLSFAGSYFLLANIRYFPYSWLFYLLALFIFGVLIRLGGIPEGKLKYVAAFCQIVAPIGIIWVCYSGNLNFMDLLLAVWVWSLSVQFGFLAGFFSKPKMLIAGSASYSLYMIHWLVFGYVSVVIETLGIQNIYILKITTICTLLLMGFVSWACWKFFEIPCRRSMNAYFERRWPQ